jgi:hypothetical protein
MAKASDEKLARRARAGRWKAFRSASRTCSPPRACTPRPAAMSSTASSRVYESTVTANLWADGAVMLGKLNMDEFAMGSSNETSYYGPVKNPWRADGSNKAGAGRLVRRFSAASAVAAHLCMGATATDTGGSIRQPAAFTGTVGIKPTYGRCSRWGIVAFASSLDQAGPIARDVRDAAIMLKSMASVDAKDTTSVDVRCRTTRPPRPVGQGHEDRHSGRIPHGRHARRDRDALAAGHRVAEGCRRRDRRHLAAAHQIRRCRPITSSRRRRPRRTSPATTACATACACRAGTSPRCTKRPAPKASATRSSAAS